MGITPAERRSYDERLQKTREDYETRESELQKRRNEELKRLEKRHREELAKVSEDYQRQLEEIQNRNRETMTDRDRRHRDEVDEIKGLYVGQLRKKMEENASQRRELENTYQESLTRQKQVSESQKGNLSERQNAELARRDQQVNEILQQARQETRTGITENREKLQQAHERDMELSRREREDLVLRKEKEKGELRKAYEQQVKQEKRMRNQSEENWSQKYYDTTKTMQDEYAQNLDASRSHLSDAVAANRDKYQAKLAEKEAKLEELNESFRDDVNNRQNTQVRSRDYRIQALETRLNNEIMNAERSKNLEKENLTRAYEARYQDLEKQKGEVLDQSANLTRDRVNQVMKKNDQVLRNANRDYRSQMSLVNSRNREERKLMVEQQADQINQTRNSADKRVRQMQKLTTENARNLQNYYDDSLEQLRVGFSERVDNQREAHLEEQTKLANVMSGRVRDLENRYQQKLEQTVGSYEDKLARLKEDYQKELKSFETATRQRLTEREKGHRIEKESLEQKYEAKLAVTEERHQEEINRLRKRHEEDLKAVATRVNSYNRKA